LNQCQGKQHDSTPCPKQVVSGTHWCIFHHPNKDQELVAKFEDEFPHEYERQMSKTVDKFLDFTGFHFPSKREFKGVLPSIFFNGAVFNQDLYFGTENQNCQLNGPTHFEHCQFKGNVYFHNVNIHSGINFMHSKFEGDTYFYNTYSLDFNSFEYSEFIGNVDFQGSDICQAHFLGGIFNKATHFKDTSFFEQADFRNSTFKNITYFDGSTFEGSVDFQGAVFENRADFFNNDFNKKANFDGVKFNKLAFFDNSQFNDLATFKNTNFGDSASFCRVYFIKGVDFSNAIFLNTTLFDYSNFKEVSNFQEIVIQDIMSLRQTMVEGRLNFNVKEWKDSQRNEKTTLIIFNDPIVTQNGKIILEGTLGKIDKQLIKGVSLLNTELEKIEFINEEWPHLNNNVNLRKTCIDEYLLKPYYTQELAILHYDVTAPQVGQLYRRLRENYENAKRYSEAGDFLIGEMEMRRKYDPSWYNRQLLRLYKELALYGESIGRPLFWSGLLIVLATGCITFVLNRSITQTEFLSMFIDILPQVFMSFFPFGQATTFYFFIIKLLGSLLLGAMFIAVRRRLERR